MPYDAEMGRAFWFELDRQTLYNEPFMEIVIRSGAGSVQQVYARTRVAGTYPEEFAETYRPFQDEWHQLAEVQTSTIRDQLQNNWEYVQAAFEDFGQGVLVDTDPVRISANDQIHLMDVQNNLPPVGYHRWHASIRVFQLLGIGDPDWWENLDRLVGLGWAVQSFGKPRQQVMPNPAIPEAKLQELRDAWLPLSSSQRDRQYDLTGSSGYHPTPLRPVP